MSFRAGGFGPETGYPQGFNGSSLPVIPKAQRKTYVQLPLPQGRLLSESEKELLQVPAGSWGGSWFGEGGPGSEWQGNQEPPQFEPPAGCDSHCWGYQPCNVGFTRMDEIRNGIDVSDADGNVLGRSVAAGKIAVFKTVTTRSCFLPIFPLVIPPLTMKALGALAGASPTHNRNAISAPLYSLARAPSIPIPSSSAVQFTFGTAQLSPLTSPPGGVGDSVPTAAGGERAAREHEQARQCCCVARESLGEREIELRAEQERHGGQCIGMEQHRERL